jgi:hypothetical protein
MSIAAPRLRPIALAALAAVTLTAATATESLALSCKRGFRIVWQGAPGGAIDEAASRRDAKHLIESKGPVWRGGIGKAELITRAADPKAAANTPRFFSASASVEKALRGEVSAQSPLLIVVWPSWPELKLSDDAAEKAVQRFLSNIARQQEKSGPGLVFADTVDALLAQGKQSKHVSPELQLFEAHKGKVLIRIADCENETYWKADQPEAAFLAAEVVKPPEPAKKAEPTKQPAKK